MDTQTSPFAIKLPNPTAKTFSEACGISPERSAEVGPKIQELVRNAFYTDQISTMAALVEKLSKIATTQGEFVYCTIAGMMLLQRVREQFKVFQSTTYEMPLS